MSPPFFLDNWVTARVDEAMIETKSRPDHDRGSRDLTGIMWNSVHIIEAVVHSIVFVVKIATAPVWWPISLLNGRKRPRQTNQTTVQSTDAYTTDLNRPLFK